MSTRRLVDTGVVLAWCALFWFVLLTGRTPLYLSSRTDWLIPVGAGILTLISIGKLLSLKSEHDEPLDASRIWSAVLLVTPVLLVVSLPPASLGAFAASRRGSLTSAGLSADASEIAEGPIDLIDIASALRSDDAMEVLRSRAGDEVTLVGFVTRDESDPVGTFTLNRFIISCCVADAIAVKVQVLGAAGGEVEEDDWARVKGRIFPLEDQVAVDAVSIERIERPKSPYLDP